MKRGLYLLFGTLLIPAVCLSFGGQEVFEAWQDQYVVPDSKGILLDVPYVQTENYIVNEMLKLLEIRSGDVLYDLGCGDGRIVIEGVKKGGIRGVGIDIDPRRIAESKANAIAAHVADRTVFLQQDLFVSDFRDATAIAMFLLPELNVKLRPKLFRELKPGTRIVSHNFDMGGWKPDKKVSAGLWGDGFHNLYFWVLPANASGRWQGRSEKEFWTLSIRQKFQQIEGNLSINGNSALPFSEATITGDVIRFIVRSEQPDRSIIFEGKVTGNTMEGTIRKTGKTGKTFKAARDPATITSLEQAGP